MQHPHLLRAAFTKRLSPLPAGRERRIVSVADIPGQIAGGVELGLAEAVAEPGEAVAAVPDIPVVEAELAQGFDVMQGAAGPHAGHAGVVAVVLEAGATGLGPDGAVHEGAHVRHEVLHRLGFGRERVHVLGLEPVHQLQHVVCLCLCRRGIQRNTQAWTYQQSIR